MADQDVQPKTPLEVPGELLSLASGPLHAVPLESCASVTASEEDGGYGDAFDEKAIEHLTEALRHQPHSRGLASAELSEMAEGLYALLCRQIANGVRGEELSKMAALLGEKPETLVERLAA